MTKQLNSPSILVIAKTPYIHHRSREFISQNQK